MTSQTRFLTAILLTVMLGGGLTVSVALKAPAVKWAQIERQILNDLSQKIVDKKDVSTEEEKIAKDNKYMNLKGQAFFRLTNQKSDEALALLTWIRERSDEDPQIDYYLAQIWQLKKNPENAAKYYQRVVEKSTTLSEIADSLDRLNQNDKKSYVEVVRNFIVQQNKGSRFADLLAAHKKSPFAIYNGDKTFVLLMALCVVEGDQPEIMSLTAKAFSRYLNSEILKPYQTIEDGKARLDLTKLGDDLVGKDNPQRKEAVKISIDSVTKLAKELKKK